MSDQYYYAIDGEQHGPISFADLRNLATKDQLKRHHKVWCRGMKAWQPANSLKKLFDDLPPDLDLASAVMPPPLPVKEGVTKAGIDLNRASIELWFRKAPPVSFDDMITSQEPKQFWIIRPGIPCAEYSDDLPDLFYLAFFDLKKREWLVDNTKLSLGHGDLLVRPGLRRVGALLVNERKIPVPLRWYPSVTPVGEYLSMVSIGSLKEH